MSNQPKCAYGCRLVPILPDLWLCDHASYGRMAYLRGCVEQARAMLEHQGGYQRVREDLDRKAELRKLERKQEREEGLKRSRALLRKG